MEATNHSSNQTKEGLGSGPKKIITQFFLHKFQFFLHIFFLNYSKLLEFFFKNKQKKKKSSNIFSIFFKLVLKKKASKAIYFLNRQLQFQNEFKY